MALQVLSMLALLASALAVRSMRPEPTLATRLVAAAIVRTTWGRS